MSVLHGEHVQSLEEQNYGQVGKGRSMEWWGMIFFIASEALIFANFIAAFLYLEIHGFQIGRPWLLPDGERLPYIFPAIGTVLLILSSGTAIIGLRAIRRENRRNMIVFLSATIILGLAFLGLQIYEYVTFYHEGFSLSTGAFGSAFFLLTGFHGAHVTIGVLFLVICLIRGIRGDFTAHKHFAVEAADMYWHFVDIVWIFVFAIVYILPQFLPM